MWTTPLPRVLSPHHPKYTPVRQVQRMDAETTMWDKVFPWTSDSGVANFPFLVQVHNELLFRFYMFRNNLSLYRFNAVRSRKSVCSPKEPPERERNRSRRVSRVPFPTSLRRTYLLGAPETTFFSHTFSLNSFNCGPNRSTKWFQRSMGKKPPWHTQLPKEVRFGNEHYPRQPKLTEEVLVWEVKGNSIGRKGDKNHTLQPWIIKENCERKKGPFDDLNVYKSA